MNILKTDAESSLEPKDLCDVAIIDDDLEFRAFLEGNPRGISMVASRHGNDQMLAIHSDGISFAKWIKSHNPDIHVSVDSSPPKLLLRSEDIYLPLVFLASDVAFPVYLNLVSSYLYDRMKGALKGEVARVHMSAEYEDQATGKIKRFSFEGDADALAKAIKRFDLNRFFDD